MIIKRLVEKQAREDARRGVYQSDAYVVASQGPEPRFDPAENLEHSERGGHLQQPMLPELGEDLRREEDELARHPSHRLLLIVLVFLLIIEVAGGINVMKTLGIMGIERIVFGLAFSVFLFFMAWLVSRLRSGIRVVALLAMSALIAAVAFLRTADNAASGDGGVTSAARALVALAFTVGPALMAEHVLRQLSPLIPTVRRARELRRRIGRARSSRSGATRFVVRLAKDRSAWQREAARRRAIYEVAYRAARAEMGEPLTPSSQALISSTTTNYNPTEN